MNKKAFQKIFTKLTSITKATVTVQARGVANEEMASVDGRPAQVVKIVDDQVTLQIFQGTNGIATNSEVVFHGRAPFLTVSDDLIGRFFNAYGEPIDGGPKVEGKEVEIGGPAVNPVRRKQPSELIATGIAGIDLNNTLVSGQKIPFLLTLTNLSTKLWPTLLLEHRWIKLFLVAWECFMMIIFSIRIFSMQLVP